MNVGYGVELVLVVEGGRGVPVHGAGVGIRLVGQRCTFILVSE